MSSLVLTAEEVLTWNEKTSECFRKLFGEHAEAMQVPCDIAKAKTIGELLQHIVAVELRFAERLAGVEATDYTNIPFATAGEVYATHDRAMLLYREVMTSTEINWDEEMEFVTRTMGKLIASRKTMFFQGLTHSIRHYAQIVTILRQAGIDSGIPSLDFLIFNARRV